MAVTLNDKTGEKAADIAGAALVGVIFYTIIFGGSFEIQPQNILPALFGAGVGWVVYKMLRRHTLVK